MPPRKTKTTKRSPKTNDASWKLTTIPLHSWMLFWALILATMALASVCFTTAFRPAENQVDAEALAVFEAVKESLERQITELEGKVQIAESQRVGSVDCETTTVTPIDTHITYTHQESGVSVSLPYSFGWNGQGCEISPAVIRGGAILFGPGHIYGRYARLEIRSREAAAEVIRVELDTAPTSTDQLGAVTNVQRRNINGLSVTSYSQALDIGGTQRVWVASGRTYGYIIRDTHEWLTDAEAIKIIQSLRVVR